jgi:cell division protease FtsH
MMESEQPTARAHWSWWLFLLIVLAWNVWLFWPTSQTEVDIPYSTFLAQIRAGNVAQVQIAGDQITGSFMQAIIWPVTTVPAQPTAASPATPMPPVTYLTFHTTFPEAVGDPELLPLLQSHAVVVDVVPPASPWLMIVLTNGLPLLLLILLVVWMSRQTAKGQATIFGFGRSHARRYQGTRSEMTFADVAGADEAKAELQEVVDFLRNPQKYHILGARIPRGVLLVGPPGTGKTLLARAVAGEDGVPFFSLSASEFVEMFVGVGASRVRDLFTQARAAAPAIVFIDELDAVGRRRGAGLGTVNDEREQTLNQLLGELDGFDERQETMVLAATNRPDVLDPALLRPGRFDRQVVVALPDRPGREGILHIHTRQLRLAAEVDLSRLARTTTGMSGADLANLCNEAALIAARANHTEVTMADFEAALDKVVLGRARTVLLDPAERRVVAYHEAGHALVAWRTPAADPVQKVTIIAHGQALGITKQLPREDRYNYSRAYLLARLAVLLGGRTAEELALGEVTTGAENDLVAATQLARQMVTRWGMGSLGLVAFQADAEHPFLGYEITQGREYSEATAARIDQDVQRLLSERQEIVRSLLTSAHDHLERLAQALLQDETIDQDELIRILGPRPAADVAEIEQLHPQGAGNGAMAVP